METASWNTGYFKVHSLGNRHKLLNFSGPQLLLPFSALPSGNELRLSLACRVLMGGKWRPPVQSLQGPLWPAVIESPTFCG